MTTFTHKSDRQIHHDVIQELTWSTLVDETQVGVEVDRGVVTLTGSVSSYAKKISAEAAAHRVAGVLDVANDINVLPSDHLLRTDTEIAQAVRRALEWDVLVPSEQIISTVANGWVTLEGDVPNMVTFHYAERAVRNLVGVRGVTNQIVVKPPKVDPTSIQHAIEDALMRRAERESHHIDVHVHDGKVVLTGDVQSWREKQAVLGAAGFAPGVVTVEDHLHIVSA